MTIHPLYLFLAWILWGITIWLAYRRGFHCGRFDGLAEADAKRTERTPRPDYAATWSRPLEPLITESVIGDDSLLSARAEHPASPLAISPAPCRDRSGQKCGGEPAAGADFKSQIPNLKS